MRIESEMSFSQLGIIFPKSEIPEFKVDAEQLLPTEDSHGNFMRVSGAFSKESHQWLQNSLTYVLVRKALSCDHGHTANVVSIVYLRFIYGDLNLGGGSKAKATKSDDETYHAYGFKIIGQLKKNIEKLDLYLKESDHIDENFRLQLLKESAVAWSAIYDLAGSFGLMRFFLKDLKNINEHLLFLELQYPSLSIKKFLASIPADLEACGLLAKSDPEKVFLNYQKFQSKTRSTPK